VFGCGHAIVFIDGDANMNNSRGRKGIYRSTGLKATCLSHGRKRNDFKAYDWQWTKTKISRHPNEVTFVMAQHC
jgi:hypothetical protein